MKILMVAVNAKYIHSSLALRYLGEYNKEYSSNMSQLELTINHNENDALRSIYDHNPDVVAFSCYIWNMEMITKLITSVAKIMPGVKIVLGGPEVSFNSELIFKANPDVDIISEGEGEQTWRELLEHFVDETRSLEDINGIVFKDKDGNIKRNNARIPMNLNDIPFVYDDLSQLENKIIYYEATRGCPFNCQYCLSSTDKGVRALQIERVRSDMQFFLDNNVNQVKFIDRTFNAIPSYAMAIWDYLKENDNGVTNFHFELAADILTEEMIASLEDARPNLFQFEIGVQSTNHEVLEAIDRVMDFEQVAVKVKKIKEFNNIHQHLDLIAGLPKEDIPSFRKSFNDVIELRPEKLQLGFLKVLKGSGLHKDAEKYGLIYKEEPPYEILYTDHTSYEEMLSLHAVEEMLDRYYNSGRFTYATEYLFSLFDSPFDALNSLAIYWEDKGYHKIKHSNSAQYNILIEFTKEKTNANLTLMKELARFDFFLHQKTVNRPKDIITINQDLHKRNIRDFYRDNDNIAKFLPELEEFTNKQISRMAHIEVFSMDILSCVETLDFTNPKEKETAVVFNYEARNLLTNDAAYERVDFGDTKTTNK